MPMYLGADDMRSRMLPTGVDAEALVNWSLQDGTSYQDLVNDVSAALAVLGSSLFDDPLYGSLVVATAELSLEYDDGTQGGMQVRTERTRAEARRGATIGHMLPIVGYDSALYWTWEFLQNARMQQIDADIKRMVMDVQDNWEKKILTRLFSEAENQIETSGYDVPFVQGGAGNVDYIPPAFRGKTFASTHDHYDRKTDDAAGRAAAIDAGCAHLHEHGHYGPYDAIIPDTDRAAWTAIDSTSPFVKYIRPDRSVQYLAVDADTPYAVQPIQDERIVGFFETDYGIVRIWATARLETDFLGITKTRGRNAEGNPLKARYREDRGIGPVPLSGEGFREYPLEGMTVIHDFGIAVGESRTVAYFCRFDSSGNYSDPTIS